MYLQELRTDRNGQVYWHGANGSRLPVETQEVVRTDWKGQKLVPLEGLRVREA
ncbi:hypothetical protein [Candidatus Methylacidithermus pantelleriae]|uniref:Uncharacterized protein n=1 Tax=Candidatus Methylacidithermus pantelleriae TaxID=2744239 RepID=A0A8J2BM73_9BACT|nr:hypothetical protein [Candidatus Methylacidithermus pantelleriae]CAF0698498.1 hypothetical protein MPNT_280005 [Candidatus Methylacidithermus pantelleriae]